MAELADAPDLGSGGRPCRFKSCYPHWLKLSGSLDFTVLPDFFAVLNLSFFLRTLENKSYKPKTRAFSISSAVWSFGFRLKQ